MLDWANCTKTLLGKGVYQRCLMSLFHTWVLVMTDEHMCQNCVSPQCWRDDPTGSLLSGMQSFLVFPQQCLGCLALRWAFILSPTKPSDSWCESFWADICSVAIWGFETSANFVEEQKPGQFGQPVPLFVTRPCYVWEWTRSACVGVFPKTLRNMWVAVSFINIILPSLAVVDISASTECCDTYIVLHLEVSSLAGRVMQRGRASIGWLDWSGTWRTCIAGPSTKLTKTW